MAYKRNIRDSDQVFFDTDKKLYFDVYDGKPTAADIAAGTAVPIDVSAWDFEWMLRANGEIGESPAPLIVKTTTDSPPGITVIGTFNVDPTLNTQQVLVTLLDTDTYDPNVSPAVMVSPGNYHHALKRIGNGVETVLTYGSFKLLWSAASE